MIVGGLCDGSALTTGVADKIVETDADGIAEGTSEGVADGAATDSTGVGIGADVAGAGSGACHFARIVHAPAPAPATSKSATMATPPRLFFGGGSLAAIAGSDLPVSAP